MAETHTTGLLVVGGPYPGTSICTVVDHGCGGEYPEPPVWEPVAILDQRTSGEPCPRAQADAERLVACWNALDGLDPAAVPGLLEERRELLEALSAVLQWYDNYGGVRQEDAAIGLARAAIQKAEQTGATHD